MAIVHALNREREYLALLSYLPLKGYRKMLRFARHVRAIQKRLADTPGVIGYSLRAKLLRHRFWTVSVWEGEEALNAFVMREPHRTTMGASDPTWTRPHSSAGSSRAPTSLRRGMRRCVAPPRNPAEAPREMGGAPGPAPSGYGKMPRHL